MKMPTLYSAAVLAIATACPSIVFSQANVSRPRTGSPVIPGGAATTATPENREIAQAMPNNDAGLQYLIASQLQTTSLASIELNQFAAQRATGSDVREFAETLASDQQHFWRALQRLSISETNPKSTTQPGETADNPASASNAFGPASLTETERDNPTFPTTFYRPQSHLTNQQGRLAEK